MITQQGLLVPDTDELRSTNLKITRYDADTGRITGVREAPRVDIEADPYPYVPGEGHPETHYVADNEIKSRPVMLVLQTKKRILANGRDYAKLFGLPRPCDVFLNGEKYTVSDGEFELSSVMPGEFEITISAWPHKKWKGTVIAVAGGL